MSTCMREKLTRRVLALPEKACGAAGQKMMRSGSRIIRDKVSRKGRGKDRRGIIK
jgi:hypothetical protein